MKKVIIVFFLMILITGCNKNKPADNETIKRELPEINKKEINLDKLIDNHNEIYNNLSDVDTYINDYGYMCKKYIGNRKTSQIINDVFSKIDNGYIEINNSDNDYKVYFCIPNNCKIINIENYDSYIIENNSYINILGNEYLLQDNKLKNPIFNCEFKRK